MGGSYSFMCDSLTSRRDKQKHIVSLGLEEQVIEDRYMNKSCVPHTHTNTQL